ncbi:MAG: galactokinase, partial [Bacteroidetes bacterium]|nr:galactokinase [Bacteroidota bacterium]
MLDTNSLKEKFLTHFGYTATDTFFSPGRINLIGEHIDYSGGYVLPAAISLGITAIVEKRKDNIINVYAQNFEEAFSIDLNHPLNLSKEVGWARYVTSTLQVLQDKNTPLFGADILIDSDLPLGTGLSSSAALECLIAYIFNEKYYNQNRTELAIDAQDAEVKYVGVNCGIMDQFAVANGKKNHAILLNCDSLDFEHIPLDFGDHQLVIINSNTPRVLTESKYNERRSECDAAFQILKQFDVA